MNFRVMAISGMVLLLTVLVTSLLWQQAVFLAAVLVILFILKHRVIPVEKELLLFIFGALSGPVCELIVISNGAWSYTQPDLFGIPIWLPFLWGLAGVTGVSFYQGMINKS